MRASRKTDRLFALFVLLVCDLALSAGPVFFFVDDFERAEYDLDSVTPEDALFFKGYDDTPYVDGLYYKIETQDGFFFTSYTFFTDVGFGIKSCGMSYRLFCPDGRAVCYGTRFPVEEDTLAEDSFNWRVGPNSIGGDNNTHVIHIESGPLRADIELRAEVPFFRPGLQGGMFFDPERTKEGQITHFPCFSAKGTITEGSTVLDIKGSGYGNRLIQKNFVITDVTAFHSALRWQKQGLGFDLYDYVTTDELGGEWLPILMVHHKGRMVHVSQNYTKEVLDYYLEEKTGKRVPKSYRVTSRRKDSAVVIEFTDTSFAGYNDSLIMFSPVMKRIISFVSKPPIEVRFRGEVRISLQTPEGTITREGPGQGLVQVSQ